jgi:hypothetical protein
METGWESNYDDVVMDSFKKITKSYRNTRSHLDTGGDALYNGDKKQRLEDKGLEGKKI